MTKQGEGEGEVGEPGPSYRGKGGLGANKTRLNQTTAEFDRSLPHPRQEPVRVAAASSPHLATENSQEAIWMKHVCWSSG